jgi:uncharacterized protein with PQ loop repeat
MNISNSTSNSIEQEYYGWAGNGIFITAQFAQIVHTHSKKKTDEISYILEIMWIIGNGMYTIFGYIDNSYSMFYGNLCSLILSIIQISQKIYYDRKNKNMLYGVNYEGPYSQPLIQN